MVFEVPYELKNYFNDFENVFQVFGHGWVTDGRPGRQMGRPGREHPIYINKFSVPPVRPPRRMRGFSEGLLRVFAGFCGSSRAFVG